MLFDEKQLKRTISAQNNEVYINVVHFLNIKKC